MRVVITTTPKANCLGYRITVIVDGALLPDVTATPLQVVRMRNALIDQWTATADEVQANAIPSLNGMRPG